MVRLGVVPLEGLNYSGHEPRRLLYTARQHKIGVISVTAILRADTGSSERGVMMANPDAVNIMVLANDYSKIHAAAMLTAVAATYGKPIRIFVSMEALAAFHQNPAISSTIAQGPVAHKIMAVGGSTFIDLFRQAKELGDVTLYACSMVMDLYHWTLSDMVDIFDETLGVAGFLAMVEGETTFTL